MVIYSVIGLMSFSPTLGLTRAGPSLSWPPTPPARPCPVTRQGPATELYYPESLFSGHVLYAKPIL